MQFEHYPPLAKKTLVVHLPFSTSYLNEIGFSSQLHIKRKGSNRLNASNHLQPALSK